MARECINPEVQDYIRELIETSLTDIHDFPSFDIGTIGEARLHWNSCPACRHEFPALIGVLEKAGRELQTDFRADLCRMKDDFLAVKESLLRSSAEDANLELVVKLASVEEEVHAMLARELYVADIWLRGVASEVNPFEQEILSHCRSFVASLEPEVQHFVVAATLCFELFRPMWERVGLPLRFDNRTLDEMIAEPR